MVVNRPRKNSPKSRWPVVIELYETGGQLLPKIIFGPEDIPWRSRRSALGPFVPLMNHEDWRVTTALASRKSQSSFISSKISPSIFTKRRPEFQLSPYWNWQVSIATIRTIFSALVGRQYKRSGDGTTTVQVSWNTTFVLKYNLLPAGGWGYLTVRVEKPKAISVFIKITVKILDCGKIYCSTRR